MGWNGDSGCKQESGIRRKRIVLCSGNNRNSSMTNDHNINLVSKTVIGLEAWMKENCFNFLSYSINGNFIHEGHGIERSGGLFIWYYTERGQQNNLQYFSTEEAV